MAAIVDEQGVLDLGSLYSALQTRLPAYSRPIFIRLMKQAADTTGSIRLVDMIFLLFYNLRKRIFLLFYNLRQRDLFAFLKSH